MGAGRLLVILLLGTLISVITIRYLISTKANASSTNNGPVEVVDDKALLESFKAANVVTEEVAKGEESTETTKTPAATPTFKPLELIRPPEHLRLNLEQQTADMKAVCSLPYYSLIGKEATYTPETHRLVASHIIVTPGVTAPYNFEPHSLSKQLLEGLDCSFNVSTWSRLLYPPLKELLHFLAAQKAPNTSIEQYIRDTLAPEDGKCKFGQLTPTGLVQNILVGKYLGHIFTEKNGLVSVNESHKVLIRALDEQATFIAAVATGFGFFQRGKLDLRYLKVRQQQNEWFCQERWNMTCSCTPADDMAEDVWTDIDRTFTYFNPPDINRIDYVRWASLFQKLDVEPHEFFPQLRNTISHYCAQVEFPCIAHEEEADHSEAATLAQVDKLDKVAASAAAAEIVQEQVEKMTMKVKDEGKKKDKAKKGAKTAATKEAEVELEGDAKKLEEKLSKTLAPKPKTCAPFNTLDFKTAFEAYNSLSKDLNTNRFNLASDTLRVFPYLLELISRMDSTEQRRRNDSDDYLKVSITLAKPEFVTALKRTLGINMEGRMTGFASRLSFEIYETIKRNPGELLIRIVENGQTLTMAASKACEKTYQTMCQLQRFREYLVTRLMIDNVGIADYKRACKRQPVRPPKHIEHDSL